MTDLLTLLLSTLSSLLAPGVSEQQLEAKLAQVVLAGQPAPLEDVTVDATGIKVAAAEGDATGAEKVEFKLRGITLDDLQVERATFTINGIQRSAAAEGGATGKGQRPEGAATEGAATTAVGPMLPRLSVKSVSWSASIQASELTKALRAEGGELKDATVSITPAGLTLRGKWPLGLGMRVGYSVTGNLSVEGSRLNFHIDHSEMSGLGVPGGINTMIEAQVNPVYDFAKFAARSEKELKLAREQLNYDFKLTVTKIEPREGHIIVHGSA